MAALRNRRNKLFNEMRDKFKNILMIVTGSKTEISRRPQNEGL